MRSASLLVVLLFAIPAAAGPELTIAPGVGTALSSSSPRRDLLPTLRLSVGWSFAGHALALGWRADAFNEGTSASGDPFLSYRTPVSLVGERVGIVGLLAVRDAVFPFCGTGGVSCPSVAGGPAVPAPRRWPIVSAGIGLTVPFEWVLLVPALELGAAFPGTREVQRLVVPAFTLGLVVRHDEGITEPFFGDLRWCFGASAFAGPLVARGNGSFGAGGLGGVSVDAGLGGKALEGGLRLAFLGGVDTAAGATVGPGVLAFMRNDSGRIGDDGVLRGGLAAGMAAPMRCSGDTCQPFPEALAMLDVIVSWPWGAREVELGGRLLVEYNATQRAMWFSTGVVAGVAWR